MGKRGPSPKPPERAQGHRKRELAVVSDLPVPAVPRAPKGLRKELKQAWKDYWESDVARASTDVDLPLIRRLFRLRERFEVAMEVAEKAPAVKGSTGQIRVSPFMDMATQLNTQILRIENELGLTPLSRARLGIAVGEAQLTLEELNRSVDNHDYEAEEEDPRVAADEGAEGL